MTDEPKPYPWFPTNDEELDLVWNNISPPDWYSMIQTTPTLIGDASTILLKYLDREKAELADINQRIQNGEVDLVFAPSIIEESITKTEDTLYALRSNYQRDVNNAVTRAVLLQLLTEYEDLNNQNNNGYYIEKISEIYGALSRHEYFESADPVNRTNDPYVPGGPGNTSVPGGQTSPPTTNPNRGENSNSFATSGVYNSYAGVDIVASIIIPGETGPLEIGELQTISYSIHRENVPVRVLGRVGPRGFVKGPRTIAGSLIFTQFDKYAFYKLSAFKEHLLSGVFPLSDMLPPFDVTISFANEFGSFSKMRIYGVTIVDEGSTMSIDDLITEQTFTYMARGIQPMVNYIPDGLSEITDNSAITDPARRRILDIGG